MSPDMVPLRQVAKALRERHLPETGREFIVRKPQSGYSIARNPEAAVELGNNQLRYRTSRRATRAL